MLFCNRKIIFDYFCYRYCSASKLKNTSFVFINIKSCSKIWLCLRNQSQLNEVDFALTHLRPKDLEYLEKTLKRNSPYKVRGGSFGDDKIIEVCNGEIVGEYEGKL